MAVQFKNLLPSKMRSTMWGDLLTAYQKVDDQVRSGIINPIFNQYTTSATTAELIKLGSFLGIKILSLDKYTLSKEYLIRQIQTAVLRIKSKTSRKSYNYIGYIYNLDNIVYPMMTSSEGTLTSKLSTVYDPDSQLADQVIITDQEGDNLYYTKDVENWETDQSDTFITDMNVATDYTADVYGDPQTTGSVEAFTDTDVAVSTDGVIIDNKGTTITQVTRNLTFSYYHKFLDSETEWYSKYNYLCLKNDIDQIHKATEVVYYEPWLKLYATNTSGEVVNKTYYNYDFTISGQIHSVFQDDYILNSSWIEFGTGSHWNDISGLPNNISGVQNFSYHIPYSVSGQIIPDSYIPSGVAGWNYFADPTATSLSIDFIIPEFNQFTEFTELAIKNATSGCIFYSTFPKVQWHQSMYNNIRVEINLV